MKRMDKLAEMYTSRTTKDYDHMTLAELKRERANMKGWLDEVMTETGARGVVELDGMERLPSLYDMAAVEAKMRAVEVEIVWRERGE